MKISISDAPRFTALALMMAVAACSNTPKGRVALPPPPQATTASEIDAILALLDSGDIGAAKKRIGAALKRDPMNAEVLVLRDSIERDPKELLGPDSYAYTTRPGDTMASLAQRFLGNRLKAYQLARYNGIAKPSALVPGQVLRIPGEPPRIEVPRHLDTRPEPAAAAPSKPKPAAPKPAAVVKKAPAANPIAARQARSAGLAALNQGNVARAVGMLRRAATLDPGNPVIERDLARAERIAATVKARK